MYPWSLHTFLRRLQVVAWCTDVAEQHIEQLSSSPSRSPAVTSIGQPSTATVIWYNLTMPSWSQSRKQSPKPPTVECGGNDNRKVCLRQICTRARCNSRVVVSCPNLGAPAVLGKPSAILTYPVAVTSARAPSLLASSWMIRLNLRPATAGPARSRINRARIVFRHNQSSH